MTSSEELLVGLESTVCAMFGYDLLTELRGSDTSVFRDIEIKDSVVLTLIGAGTGINSSEPLQVRVSGSDSNVRHAGKKVNDIILRVRNEFNALKKRIETNSTVRKQYKPEDLYDPFVDGGVDSEDDA